MQVKTLLNQVLKHKGFIYEKVSMEKGKKGAPPERITVHLRPRKNGQALCSGCEKAGGVYDHLEERSFAFVPLWGIPVVLLYAMRRVACDDCGIRVEKVPWAVGKSRLTIAFACYLAEWARDMSWSKVATRFKTTWYHVYEAVAHVVRYGKEHRVLKGIRALGIDEIAWSKGHNYLTLVYQIDGGCRRLLWIGRDRTEQTLVGFFEWFKESRSKGLRYICSDMWQPYLKVIDFGSIVRSVGRESSWMDGVGVCDEPASNP